jgi:hypothetical protein
MVSSRWCSSKIIQKIKVVRFVLGSDIAERLFCCLSNVSWHVSAHWRHGTHHGELKGYSSSLKLALGPSVRQVNNTASSVMAIKQVLLDSFRSKLLLVITSVRDAKKTNYFSIRKKLILFKEITAAYSENHMKPITVWKSIVIVCWSMWYILVITVL